MTTRSKAHKKKVVAEKCSQSFLVAFSVSSPFLVYAQPTQRYSGRLPKYYTIVDCNWTNPAIWSLEENGPPSTVYPYDIDKVVIKGHEVTVSSNIKSAGITITSINDNTRLKIEGNTALLNRKRNIHIVISIENNTNTAEVLSVQNEGMLDVMN